MWTLSEYFLLVSFKCRLKKYFQSIEIIVSLLPIYKIYSNNKENCKYSPFGNNNLYCLIRYFYMMNLRLYFNVLLKYKIFMSIVTQWQYLTLHKYLHCISVCYCRYIGLTSPIANIANISANFADIAANIIDILCLTKYQVHTMILLKVADILYVLTEKQDQSFGVC